MLEQFPGRKIRVFVVWEPVLPSDWGAPSTIALNRISDSRATQFWDRRRLVSHSLGEHDRKSIVWDHIAVYGWGELWKEKPPDPLFADGPVVRVRKPALAAIGQALSLPVH